MATEDEARKALLSAIKGAAEESAGYADTTRTAMIRDAALAYRAVVGGEQPQFIHLDGDVNN